MSFMELLMWAIFWMVLASVFFFIWENRKLSSATSKSVNLVSKANKKKEKILDEAKQEAHLDREEKIEKKFDEITKKQEHIIKEEDSISEIKKNLYKQEEELAWKISEIAQLSQEDAKKIFLEDIAQKYESDGCYFWSNNNSHTNSKWWY